MTSDGSLRRERSRRLVGAGLDLRRPYEVKGHRAFLLLEESLEGSGRSSHPRAVVFLVVSRPRPCPCPFPPCPRPRPFLSASPLQENLAAVIHDVFIQLHGPVVGDEQTRVQPTREPLQRLVRHRGAHRNDLWAAARLPERAASVGEPELREHRLEGASASLLPDEVKFVHHDRAQLSEPTLLRQARYRHRRLLDGRHRHDLVPPRTAEGASERRAFGLARECADRDGRAAISRRPLSVHGREYLLEVFGLLVDERVEGKDEQGPSLSSAPHQRLDEKNLRNQTLPARCRRTEHQVGPIGGRIYGSTLPRVHRLDATFAESFDHGRRQAQVLQT